MMFWTNILHIAVTDVRLCRISISAWYPAETLAIALWLIYTYQRETAMSSKVWNTGYIWAHFISSSRRHCANLKLSKQVKKVKDMKRSLDWYRYIEKICKLESKVKVINFLTFFFFSFIIYLLFPASFIFPWWFCTPEILSSFGTFQTM